MKDEIINFRIEKELKELAIKNAEIENRSLSNYISHLIIDDDNRKKDNPII